MKLSMLVTEFSLVSQVSSQHVVDVNYIDKNLPQRLELWEFKMSFTKTLKSFLFHSLQLSSMLLETRSCVYYAFLKLHATHSGDTYF